MKTSYSSRASSHHCVVSCCQAAALTSHCLSRSRCRRSSSYSDYSPGLLPPQSPAHVDLCQPCERVRDFAQGQSARRGGHQRRRHRRPCVGSAPGRAPQSARLAAEQWKSGPTPSPLRPGKLPRGQAGKGGSRSSRWQAQQPRGSPRRRNTSTIHRKEIPYLPASSHDGLRGQSSNLTSFHPRVPMASTIRTSGTGSSGPSGTGSSRARPLTISCYSQRVRWGPVLSWC
jgi:hypothetical protein